MFCFKANLKKSFHRISRILLVGIFLCPFGISARASTEYKQENAKIEASRKSLANVYILGAGDTLLVNLTALPELSGNFTIGPDGFLLLPQLEDVYAEGLTLDELRNILLEKYNIFVKSPNLYLRIINYRPVRVYVAGEVVRPGFYVLKGVTKLDPSSNNPNLNSGFSSLSGSIVSPQGINIESTIANSNRLVLFPSLFDAIRSAQGVTPYSSLSNVEVIRNNPKSFGGGKVKSSVRFMDLFTEGDQSQNIRIFDGDTIKISKSSEPINKQIAYARDSNLSPDTLQVFVSGNVRNPGIVKLPHGSSLTQAIALAGGMELLSGRLQFLRFGGDGEIDRREFNFNEKAEINSYQNPQLIEGDIINVKQSFFGITTDIITKVTAPAVTSYTLYKLFDLN